MTRILGMMYSALFISNNTDRYANKIEIRPWSLNIHTPLVFELGAATINRGNDVV